MRGTATRTPPAPFGNAARAAVVAVVGVLIGLTLAAMAAGAGPVLHPHFVDHPHVQVGLVPGRSAAGHVPGGTAAAPSGGQSAVSSAPGHRAIGRSDVLIVLIVVAVLLALAAGRLWIDHYRRSTHLRPWARASGGPGAKTVEAALLGAAAALDADSSPRAAVIACWTELERAIAESGSARDPAEAPAEFAHRVLTQHGVDRAALGRLHASYVSARYSTAAVSEADRDDARTALQTVRRSVHRSSPATAAEPVGTR